MEACWLLALIMIPVYFSLLSDRHFEPDKATVLRSLVLVLGAAWIINILERGQVFRDWPRWRTWRKAPLMIPALVYAGVFLLTTFTSILIWTSFWGGYNRLQGTYTNLSYIVVFAAIVAHVRRREQLERLITVIVATALPVLAYGWVQHRAIDPLPWAGNTAARVASTMGNSIFVAAYLILVLPFTLYRLCNNLMHFGHSDHALYAARDEDTSHDEPAPAASPTWLDLAWLGTLGLLAVGQIATLYGILKLGALLQAPLLGFNHWWIFPGAVIVTGATLPLFSYRTTVALRNDWRIYLPGALIVLYILAVLMGGYLNAPDCGQGATSTVCYNVNMATASRATDFNTWLLLGIGSYFLFYVLVVLLPRRTMLEPSKLMRGISSGVYALLALATILVIFFTQSRGPQMGMFVSLFTFVTLFLIQAWRTMRRKIFLGLLSAWMLLAILGGGFLVILNTTDQFAGLRQNAYIARLSNLLETEGGTGRVRVLIWRGDNVTRGAVGLVTDNPVRTLIGWGPEAMFVAYNPFYPPELATLESRGASPDRSHQAMLDELVTKGALGLFSYLFLYGSFAILMMRLLQVNRLLNLLLTSLFMLGIAVFFAIFLESIELGAIALVAGLIAVGLAAWLGYARPLNRRVNFGWQMLIIACVSAVVANFVENVFGIPIVSTLLYTWTIMGMGVLAGMFAGVYQLGEEAVVAAPVEEELVEETPPSAGGTRKQRQRAAQRSAQRNRGRSGGRSRSAPWRSAYPLFIIIALLGTWFLNLDSIYADMRFLQGKQWIEQGNSIEAHMFGYAALQDAISAAPHEDLYYLTFGRALMTLATDVSTTQNQLIQQNQDQNLAAVSNRQPRADASLQDLPDVDYTNTSVVEGARTFVQSFGPLQMLDYARLALEEAKQLNPGNKDHPANLGRLHASWYRNTQASDPEGAQKHLEAAISNYEQAHKIAPQDVELSGQWAMLYPYRNELDKAEQILSDTLKIDPTYSNNLARMAEIKRRQGDIKATAEYYSKAVANNPRVMGALLDVAELPAERQQRINDTMAAMQSDPALLNTFLAGYQQAIENRPNDLGYRQVYVQVLSDTLQYKQALEAAQDAVDLATEQNNDSMRTTFENFVRYFEVKVAGR